MKPILFILLGLTIGGVFFFLGDADDAPGLSFIGLALAFILIMRGIYHAKIIRKGYHVPIILFVFGVVAMVFPLILFLDGELMGLTSIVWIGAVIGILLVVCAIGIIIKQKKHN